MFGRIPCLPIDVLFRTVLDDPAVVSYDKYVASLTRDLKETMVIAQIHVTKKQHRHTELYNRRVKGPTIEVGDRVLLANKRKGERGRLQIVGSPLCTLCWSGTLTHIRTGYVIQ